jgi:SusD family.
MKKILSISFITALVFGLTSCGEWLDINVDPNTPSNAAAPVEQRLPFIQHHYMYGWAAASIRASNICGLVTANSRTTTVGFCAGWNPAQGMSTTPYQHWFVCAAANIPDLLTKAEAEEAWHYMGAAYTIRAMGSMLMLDWYGEMPYTEAVTASLSPKYDDGKTIFDGCMADLNKALEYFAMSQPASATPLKSGDDWSMGGNPQAWVKMIHGLKARWMLNCSKKSSFSADAVLAELALAPQSVSESAMQIHVLDPNDRDGDVLVGDPMKSSVIFDGAAWSDGARYTKWYKDLLANTFVGGSGVEDPRLIRMLPMAQFNINGEKKFVVTAGVDMITSDIRLNSGPMLGAYNTTTKTWSINTTNPLRLGDTIYVSNRSLCSMTGANGDESTWQAADGTVLSTGTFYTRPESPSHILGYPEVCFMKAELLFRKGDKAGALTAYKDGIRAHMELMNVSLNSYGTSPELNPGKQPIPASEITAFLASAAVAQNANELTMAKIMTQKYIALSYTQQTWNDMRRFNYSAGNIADFGVVYPGFERPYEFGATEATKMPGTTKSDPTYWFRRVMHCSHETNYNLDNLLLSNPKARALDVWSMPVWWDIAE